MPNPKGDTIISAHDIIILLGLPAKVTEVTYLLSFQFG
jgi:hypothetical protein